MAHQSSLIEKDIHAYLKQQEKKSILRVMTCGSVDDGKSTLIGRLLHDSKMIYEDQIAAVAQASKTAGTQGDDIDLALLVDGLQAEREQGITIDVAYRYFSTEKRKFIIADTPGHEQYTRNMVTGASNCEAAMILIDAREGHGVLPQTKRHSFLTALLDIKHVVIAINKMDAVGYSQVRFEEIKREYMDFASHLNIQDIHFVPISALKGDNIVIQSEHTPWYQGGTLMYLLENLHVGVDENRMSFRFPVQYVSRPNPNFRGYMGTVVAGEIRVGDSVLVLPSRQLSMLTNINTFAGDQERAFAGQAVTLQLEDDISVSRGDMLVRPEGLPELRDQFDAMLVWMVDEPSMPNQRYLFKINNQQVVGRLSDIRHKVDINQLDHLQASTLSLNEIAQVSIHLTRPVALDPYQKNHYTGSFIVIDRLSNLTVGAGMILSHDEKARQDVWVAEPKTNRRIIQHESRVSAEARAEHLSHQATSVVFIGLNGSGKTVLAIQVEKALFERKVLATLIDGQRLRLGLCRDIGFTTIERAENLRRGMEVARHITRAGVIALCCFVAPSEAARQNARDVVGADRFLLVHLDAPLEVCRARDLHGVYDAADKGEIADLPGVSADFEVPEAPDLYLPTHKISIEESVEKVLYLLEDRGIIPSAN